MFPLKGKLQNVRQASHKSAIQNAEFAAIKAILGLDHGRSQASDGGSATELHKKLRYGKVMLMTDQDHDGSHIKGLFFNMLHWYWPELIKKNGFVCEFVTPLIKAFPTKSSNSKTEPEAFYR